MEKREENVTNNAYTIAKQYIADETERFDNGEMTDETEIRRYEIASAAVAYVGRLKYYYGADDVKNGISDCSAFISDILGISRTTTADIIGWSRKSYGELEPGDLLCKDGHVRMFICMYGDYYLTVENTSGSDGTDGVHGCSAGLYSRSDLNHDGYVAIDISDKLYSLANKTILRLLFQYHTSHIFLMCRNCMLADA